MTTDELLQRWRDGTITVEELRELTANLAEPKHQYALLDDWLLESSLPDVLPGVAVAGLRKSETSQRTSEMAAPEMKRWIAWLSWRPLAAAAAVIVLGVAASWWLVAGGDSLMLTDAADRVFWQEAPGFPKRPLSMGERVKPGTLTLEGDGAGAQLRFRDGSLLTLTAGAELTWHEDGGKRLFLRSGELAADVAPQPKGRPMTVTTPTSEATVLGTTFSIAVKADRTLLQVDKGLVSMQRLPGREEVKVQGGQRLVASDDPRTALKLTPALAPVLEWRADLSNPLRYPSDSLWRAPGIVAAIPLDFPDTNGGTTRYYRVRFPIAWTETPRLTERSRVMVRYRVSSEGAMGVGMVARDDGYHFKGVYQSYFSSDVADPDAKGWRSLEVPVSQMTGIRTHAGQTIPKGAEWRTCVIFVASKGADLGLDIGGAEFFAE